MSNQRHTVGQDHLWCPIVLQLHTGLAMPLHLEDIIEQSTYGESEE
jgi:hypothetical protein